MTWDIETEHLSFSHARLIMNMVMLGVDCLPRGGTIKVKVRNQTDGLGLRVSVAGERCKLRTDTADAISGKEPQDGWSARTVQPLFTRIIAEGLGGKIEAEEREGEVALVAVRVSAEG